jgi:hypothetical protein
MPSGDRKPLDDDDDDDDDRARWKTRGVVSTVHDDDGIDDDWGSARGGHVQPTDRLVV